MSEKIYLIILAFLLLNLGCEEEKSIKNLELINVFAGSQEIDLKGSSENIPVDRSFVLQFSTPVDKASAQNSVRLLNDGIEKETTMNFQSDDKTIVLYPFGVLENKTEYTLEITNQLTASNGSGFPGIEISFKTVLGDLKITSILVNGINVLNKTRIVDVPQDFSMEINFSQAVNTTNFKNSLAIQGPTNPSYLTTVSNGNKTFTVTSQASLKHFSKYQVSISNTLKAIDGESFGGYSNSYYTTIDPTPKFPVISDDELLTLVQQQTFKYFWDFGHPNAGLARERNSSGDIVTTGGSGFGIMAMIVAMERGFITRQQGLDRMDKILDFLETCDRFHGVWPHWLNGNTGAVVPFSPNDNGGDLVETAFLTQGLLAFRQYLNESIPEESALRSRITALWQQVEWDWYTQGGQDVLYWHWSPDKGWIMNLPIRGWNEALIIYVLAASSPTHSINKSVYTKGFARDGGIVNGNSYYGISLPLGSAMGGPLFFAHYSFLGLDPRNLSDTYANYWMQNVNHSLINHAHCVANPNFYVGYSASCWGLTASDGDTGYSAHSPTNDRGVITPTAALSSFPYTPDESMEALKFFYYTLGDRTWGQYGFYDAFNPTADWYATSTLAIDQGPIIVMIENYRTGLIWDLFMSAPEISNGLNELGFSY